MLFIQFIIPFFDLYTKPQVMSRICIIIPARFQSSRFPGKLLKEIKGKSIIRHVYENCLEIKMANKVIVATDHENIMNHCIQNNMDCIMTSSKHISGTDRVNEVISRLDTEFDYIINVQGDEPMLKAQHINPLISTLLTGKAEIATLYSEKKAPASNNPNEVKLVTTKKNKVLYFSRNQLPFYRNSTGNNKCKIHIGVYGFKPSVLEEVTALSPSFLEQSEMLEQLRWLENGYDIYASKIDYSGIGIDTEEDLKNVSFML